MDLNAPLGLKPPPKRRGRAAFFAGAAAITIGLVGVGFFFVTADPHGGEPYAVVPVPAQQPTKTAAASQAPDPTPTGSLPAAGAQSDTGQTATAMNAASIEGGIKVFRGGAPGQTGGASSGPLVIDVTKALDEQARKKAATPGPASDNSPSTPRIAIFVSGMGLSADATRTAIDTMPPGVDLAFVPYGETVAASVASAKAKGHEVLLQIPMQNGAGGAAPGPHALTAGEPDQKFTDDFAWLSSRYSGYAGVTNLLGASVTADTPTMTLLMKAVAAKGLFYLDDGTSTRSAYASVAANTGASALSTDLVLDATSDPKAVAANLDKLVAIAKDKGHAVGMASGLPDHLAVIARFAGNLDGKGVTLVPVSALAGRDPSMAAAR